jgi:hypothetical protein
MDAIPPKPAALEKWRLHADLPVHPLTGSTGRGACDYSRPHQFYNV